MNKNIKLNNSNSLIILYPVNVVTRYHWVKYYTSQKREVEYNN